MMELGCPSRPQLIPHATQSVKLHPVDLDMWDDRVYADPFYTEAELDELDELWPYRFKVSIYVSATVSSIG